MLKRITLLSMALAAFVAFAVPAFANAAQLTDAGGSVLPGETINATSTNTVTKTGLGELKCEHVEIHGVVTTNSGGNVAVGMDEEEGHAPDTATGCTLKTVLGTSKVSIEPTFEGLTGSGTGPGHAAFSFSVGGICTAQAAAAGSSVTWNGTSTIQITAAVTGSCGTGTLTGSFNLSDEEGAVVAEN